MAHDAQPPGDGDHVEHDTYPPGIVVGGVQLGRVWVRPYNGDAKWSAVVGDIRVVRRHESTAARGW
jgi:hypothetical protein